MQMPTRDELNLHWNNLNAFYRFAKPVAEQNRTPDHTDFGVHLTAVIAASRAYMDKLNKHNDPDFRIAGKLVVKHWAEHKRKAA